MQRRTFLASSAGFLGTRALAQSPNAQSPKDRVRLAIIGMGGRGNQLLRSFTKIPFVEVAAVVDPDGNRAEQAAEWVRTNTGKAPKTTGDMRVVFDDAGIDAVAVATTNHWHALTAIWAIQAGKDVYVEKPVSHNVFEGRQLLAAARKYNRIVQGGTQRRSFPRFRNAVRMLHDGVIGEVYLSKFVFPGNRDSIGFKPTGPPPGWLNWDLWLGPAPEQPYHGNLVHYNWHWFWDFGNGELGNNGIHLVDVSRWGMRKELPVRVNSWGGRFGYKDQAETPNTQSVRWEYADGTAIEGELRGLYTPEPMSWDFFGSKGHMHIYADGMFTVYLGRSSNPDLTLVPDPDPEISRLPDQGHQLNFVEAVRSRNRDSLTAEIREAVLSTAHCHLGNIAYRVGEELRFDPAIQRFVNHDRANELLTRKYRAPYVVPETI